MLAWIYLVISIGFEVAGTFALKYSAITNSPMYSWLTALFYVISFSLMWFAIKKIDISIAYAIWAGAGTALISILGFTVLKEQFSLAKALCLVLIIAGVAGLKYLSGENV